MHFVKLTYIYIYIFLYFFVDFDVIVFRPFALKVGFVLSMKKKKKIFLINMIMVKCAKYKFYMHIVRNPRFPLPALITGAFE